MVDPLKKLELGKKLGPLPRGAWIGIIGGGLALGLYLRHKKSAAEAAEGTEGENEGLAGEAAGSGEQVANGMQPADQYGEGSLGTAGGGLGSSAGAFQPVTDGTGMPGPAGQSGGVGGTQGEALTPTTTAPSPEPTQQPYNYENNSDNTNSGNTTMIPATSTAKKETHHAKAKTAAHHAQQGKHVPAHHKSRVSHHNVKHGGGPPAKPHHSTHHNPHRTPHAAVTRKTPAHHSSGSAHHSVAPAHKPARRRR